MNLYQTLAVISLTTLIATFTSTGFAEDESKKDDAVKDRGQTLTGRVPGCTLKVVSKTKLTLYSDRSLHGIPIAKVPAGSYKPLDYVPGWYKIRAKGWIAWVHDPDSGADVQKTTCPNKSGEVK